MNMLLSVFGSNIAGDEQVSPMIEETRVENPFPGQNKARKLKEKGKAKEELAFREEMASSLRLMVEQKAIAVEEMKHRHKEWGKEIQEEMDDRNMERNTRDYTPMSKAYFDRKKREIMTRQGLFTAD
ncbi:hypothetical protein D8674_011522 [Pyrus ussuriensis x Pyrus communis]|uniref:Uncharacterized protein n=1 Tax=Pyrus ussuriensis x Pyrus communis TaxID=2448454 RepID=A0A5N5GCE1_9ROSA|nr:hypothetical protein D8674_011522 [Pyrus ussuriensis x Pyrus communis]